MYGMNAFKRHTNTMIYWIKHMWFGFHGGGRWRNKFLENKRKLWYPWHSPRLARFKKCTKNTHKNTIVFVDWWLAWHHCCLCRLSRKLIFSLCVLSLKASWQTKVHEDDEMQAWKSKLEKLRLNKLQRLIFY